MRVDYQERACPMCRSMFKPKMIDTVYCGSSCSSKSSRMRNPLAVAKQAVRGKRWYEKNRELALERAKARCNTSNSLAYMKQWHKDNKVLVNCASRECPSCDATFKPSSSINAYCSEPCRRKSEREKDWIRRRLSGRISMALKRNSIPAQKSNSTTELLGCSIEEFKSHLQELFSDGMTFENYGEWHLDHVLPCSAFELQHSEEQDVCFHYTNLQPLWAIENIKKHNKIGVRI